MSPRRSSWFAAGLLVLLAACSAPRPGLEFELPAAAPIGQRFAGLETGQWVERPGLEPNYLSGKTLLLQFGTSQCGGCQAMNTHLESFDHRYQEQPFCIVRILDGAIDDASSARVLQAESNLSGPCLIDTDRTLFHRYEITATPTFALLDPDGTILWWQATTRPELVEEWIEEGLARAKGGMDRD